MMTPEKRTHIVNKLMPKIIDDPANFSADFVEEAMRQNPELAKPRPFIVMNARNEVVCEITTTPTGARELQVINEVRVVPKPEKKKEEEDNE